jgi:hypothetical protein
MGIGLKTIPRVGIDDKKLPLNHLAANRSPSVGDSVDVLLETVDIRMLPLSSGSRLLDQAPCVRDVVSKLLDDVLVLLHIALQLHKFLMHL